MHSEAEGSRSPDPQDPAGPNRGVGVLLRQEQTARTVTAYLTHQHRSNLLICDELRNLRVEL